MFNKIYFCIKKNIKDIIIFLIISILSFVFFNYELNYNIYIPGGILNINKKIKVINSFDSSGSFNLSYVSSIKATPFTKLLSYFNKNWTVEKKENIFDLNNNKSEREFSSKLFLKESIDNALISAYNYLSIDLNVLSSNIYVVYIDPFANTNLLFKDLIKEVNGVKIDSVDDYIEIVKNAKIGEVLNLLVLRNNKKVKCFIKVKKINDLKKTGIYIINDYEIDNNDINFSFDDNESGPSAGLMMSLYIIDSLIKEDITKGFKIAGTGTIDKFGNVGAIGGVKYKLDSAVKSNCDYFIVPDGKNFNELKSYIKRKHYEIKLINVSTLEDCVKMLLKL